MNDIFELAARLSSLSAVSGREAGCFDELEKITDGIFDSTSSLPTGTFFRAHKVRENGRAHAFI